MKSLSFKLAKIVGTPTPTSWSQVYTFFPEDEAKQRQRGTLLAVFSFSSSGEMKETSTVSREILLRLHEEYYGTTESGVLEKLIEATRKICEEFSSDGAKLEITAAVNLDNILYLAVFGQGQVWLKREAMLGKIIEGHQDEVVSASGFLKEGDLVVLGTTIFFQSLGEGVFRASLEGNEPDEAVESLTPLIHSGQDSAGAAALISRAELVEEEVVEIEKEEIAPTPGLLTRFVAKVRGKLPQLSLGAIYIRRQDEEKRNRKTFFVVAIILILLLVVSLFFGAKKRDQSLRDEKFQKIYSETLTLFDQGKALVILNPTQSRELLFQAKDKLKEIEKLKVEMAKTQELKAQIESTLGQVYKEYQLDEIPVFIDLTLVTAEVKGDTMALYRDSLVVLDKGKNRVLSVDTSHKSTEVLAGGSTFEGASALANIGEQAFVLEKEGVAQIEVSSKKTERGKIKTDSEWGEILAIRAYAGNVYLFDKGKGEIWRYQSQEGDFGARQKWLGKDVLVNLQNTVAVTVDGSIWLLSDEGKITKFTQGAPVGFGLTGLVKSFSNPLVIYTDDEAKSLYVLDKGNKRIVVLTKSGEYQAEYLWEGIRDVSDMVVSESAKKIFLLSGSKIYAMDLK